MINYEETPKSFTLGPGMGRNISLIINVDSFEIFNQSLLSLETTHQKFYFPILEVDYYSYSPTPASYILNK